ncbi:hypothetical protein GQ457_03G006210 [Hibiscus cannabinus]
MSSSSRAWVVAASIGAVEALKDQGICRWNYVVRSGVQHAKNHVRSASQAKTLSSVISEGLRQDHQSKQSEESLRKVMYLSCWASIGAVEPEALKDQGICRWNHTVRSAVQHAKNHLISSQSSAAISKGLSREDKLKTIGRVFQESHQIEP